MNKLLPLALCLGSLAFCGCESMSSVSERMSERFSPASAGVTKVYPGQQRELHAAAKVAAGIVGFKVTKAGAAQGNIEAISGLASDASLRSSRQLVMRVHLEQAGEGVQVRLALSEVVQDDFNRASAMGTESPLVDSPLYGAFFRALEKQLPEPALPADSK